MTTEIIAYYRVSTTQQGESGLGLEGQKAAVEAYAQRIGGRLKATYTEVESGTLANRPELARALAHAKRSRSTLVVAKLDRLARNVRFLAEVMDSGCDFAAADMPSANRFMLHVMAAVAEHEARAISDRTKAALAAYKARGGKLGSAREGHWDGREDRRRAGAIKGAAASVRVRHKKAVEGYADILPEMRQHRAAGLSLRAIAAKLTEAGHTTRRGKPWSAMQVKLVLERVE
jgi:DNA invertase Pin-like site-specific DNA recombinase